MRDYLDAAEPTAGRAARVLRAAFGLLFALQVLVAALTTAALLPFRGSVVAGGTALSAVLIGASLAQGVLATVVHARALRAASRARDADASQAPEPRAERTAALAASLMGAALLASPAWFAGFAWLAGLHGAVVAALVALLALYYAVGVLQQSALARRLVRRRERP